MRFKKFAFFLFLIIVLAIGATSFFIVKKYRTDIPERDPGDLVVDFSEKEKETYYAMFDKNKVLDGSEQTAQEVLVKIDAKYEKDKNLFKDLIDQENSDNEKLLKALYYMNFVNFSNYYGTADMEKTPRTIRALIWEIDKSNCNTNTVLLEMLLEKAGYEARMVSINGLSHGYNEMRLDNNWYVLDATSNIWVDKSTQELMDGQKGKFHKLFLKNSDGNNPNVEGGFVLVSLRVQMSDLGGNFRPDPIWYNYEDISQWQY